MLTGNLVTQTVGPKIRGGHFVHPHSRPKAGFLVDFRMVSVLGISFATQKKTIQSNAGPGFVSSLCIVNWRAAGAAGRNR